MHLKDMYSCGDSASAVNTANPIPDAIYPYKPAPAHASPSTSPEVLQPAVACLGCRLKAACPPESLQFHASTAPWWDLGKQCHATDRCLRTSLHADLCIPTQLSVDDMYYILRHRHRNCVGRFVGASPIESSSQAVGSHDRLRRFPINSQYFLMALGKPLEEYNSAELDDLLKVSFL